MLLKKKIISSEKWHLVTLSLLKQKGVFIFSYYRLLVGAPRGSAGQPGIHKGGAVYKCPAMKTGSCELIPFDKAGNYHS